MTFFEGMTLLDAFREISKKSTDPSLEERFGDWVTGILGKQQPRNEDKISQQEFQRMVNDLCSDSSLRETALVRFMSVFSKTTPGQRFQVDWCSNGQGEFQVKESDTWHGTLSSIKAKKIWVHWSHDKPDVASLFPDSVPGEMSNFILRNSTQSPSNQNPSTTSAIFEHTESTIQPSPNKKPRYEEEDEMQLKIKKLEEEQKSATARTNEIVEAVSGEKRRHLIPLSKTIQAPGDPQGMIWAYPHVYVRMLIGNDSMSSVVMQWKTELLNWLATEVNITYANQKKEIQLHILMFTQWLKLMPGTLTILSDIPDEVWKMGFMIIEFFLRTYCLVVKGQEGMDMSIVMIESMWSRGIIEYHPMMEKVKAIKKADAKPTAAGIAISPITPYRPSQQGQAAGKKWSFRRGMGWGQW